MGILDSTPAQRNRESDIHSEGMVQTYSVFLTQRSQISLWKKGETEEMASTQRRFRSRARIGVPHRP